MCGKNPVASIEPLEINRPQTIAQVYKVISDREAEAGQFFLNITIMNPDYEILQYFRSKVGNVDDRTPFFFENRSWVLEFSRHYPTD